MRSSPVVLAGFFALLSLPAAADTISYTSAFSSEVDFGAAAYGEQFAGSLGTLTGMSIAVAGTYLPNIVSLIANPDLNSTLYYTGNAFGIGGFDTGVAGTFTLTDAGHLVGPPEAFGFSENLNSANLEAYTSPGPAFDYGFLANIDLYSRPLNGTWGSGGQWSDNSTFSGNIEVTYTYTPVPEPSTLSLLAAAACLVPLARRRVGL